MRLPKLTKLNVSGLIHGWGSKKKEKGYQDFFYIKIYK
jgi:hypothetical protein